MSPTVTEITQVTPTARPPPGQPDIQYAPDHEKWQARAARRKATEDLPATLPDGFPEQLSGPMVWDGKTVAQEYEWVYALNEAQLAEIEEALKHFKSLGISHTHITPQAFPLPTLHPELRRLSDELHNGHGFFVIRGLDPDAHTREENVIIYVGLSVHIAPQLGRQDHKFDGRPADVLLAHIKNLSSSKDNASIGSPAYTTDKQVFHTDSGDIVSLFALETSAQGGASKIASTWRVYNEIARTRPDLIHTLTQPWPYEVFEKAEKQYTLRPLMYHFPATSSAPERISLQYGRRYFVGFGALPRSSDIPLITEAQAEALDTLHFLGEKFGIATDFQKGDIQRHLMRLWLRDPENAWRTPDVLKQRWAQIYEGITPEASVLPLEPFIRSAGNKAR
ncbi:TfdA family taurine catabolism dioxygenase TauD [Bisporella sp. PMI_857]|nr:TfdA family taurine catabolism dioxygenase TauD [Bisporella sp. PMI_857]